MELYGTPGGYAATLATRYRLRGAAAVAVATVGVAVAVMCAAGSGPVAVMLAAAVVAFGAGAAARHWWGRGAKAGVGARSEKKAVAALKKAHFDGTVYCGLLVGGGGDADLICVRRDGAVFVGEVKTVFGNLTVKGTDLYSNGRALHTQPYPQVMRQVAALKRRGIAATAFIVASEARTGTGVRAGAVPVCTVAELPNLLAGAGGGGRSRSADRTLTALAVEQKLRGAGG